MDWFWLFLSYSYLGYLLEKLFAAAVKARHRVRKCMVLLPLCPVYGLGMLAVLALPPSAKENIFALVIFGGAAATAVEYAMHWLYEQLLGVRFWDYRAVRGNVAGRICPPFALAWGVLTAAAVHVLQPSLLGAVSEIPPQLDYAALLLFTADSVISAHVLRCGGDIDLMSLPRLSRYLRQE